MNILRGRGQVVSQVLKDKLAVAIDSTGWDLK